MTLTGVAISTTADPHRLGFLETSVRNWVNHLPLVSRVFVTVDGDWAAVERAVKAVAHIPSPTGIRVCQVGQPDVNWNPGPFGQRDGRLGVAANKNTGLELLMHEGVEHLWLSDDDTWPMSDKSWRLHHDLGLLHSMVCWGSHRLTNAGEKYSSWSWPRGVAMYVHCSVVEQAGGLIESFGPGGHEHVEWSRRIHQHGLTPVEFPAPKFYAIDNGRGAAQFWHCEDMQRRGEPLGNAKLRRRRLTSVRRTPSDWPAIERIMAERDGDISYVPFTAFENGRKSATLWPDLSVDRGVVQAKEPGRA